jgi:uncharacterized protein (DUF2141 family)
MIRSKLTLTFLSALIAAASAQAAPMTITVDGIEARGGRLYVGVQTEAQFMKDDGVAGQIVDAPAAGSQTFQFDLPEGVYSVSIWHDFNGNGQFDMGERGPTDGWAMINGETMRGAPAFADASFSLPASGAARSLTVIYPK